MRRIIDYSLKRDLDAQSEEAKRFPTVRCRRQDMEIEGTAKSIQAQIKEIVAKDGIVHAVYKKEECDHCSGRGWKKIKDIDIHLIPGN